MKWIKANGKVNSVEEVNLDALTKGLKAKGWEYVVYDSDPTIVEPTIVDPSVEQTGVDPTVESTIEPTIDPTIVEPQSQQAVADTSAIANNEMFNHINESDANKTYSVTANGKTHKYSGAELKQFLPQLQEKYDSVKVENSPSDAGLSTEVAQDATDVTDVTDVADEPWIYEMKFGGNTLYLTKEEELARADILREKGVGYQSTLVLKGREPVTSAKELRKSTGLGLSSMKSALLGLGNTALGFSDLTYSALELATGIEYNPAKPMVAKYQEEIHQLKADVFGDNADKTWLDMAGEGDSKTAGKMFLYDVLEQTPQLAVQMAGRALGYPTALIMSISAGMDKYNKLHEATTEMGDDKFTTYQEGVSAVTTFGYNLAFESASFGTSGRVKRLLGTTSKKGVSKSALKLAKNKAKKTGYVAGLADTHRLPIRSKFLSPSGDEVVLDLKAFKKMFWLEAKKLGKKIAKEFHRSGREEVGEELLTGVSVATSDELLGVREDKPLGKEALDILSSSLPVYLTAGGMGGGTVLGQTAHNKYNQRLQATPEEMDRQQAQQSEIDRLNSAKQTQQTGSEQVISDDLATEGINIPQEVDTTDEVSPDVTPEVSPDVTPEVTPDEVTTDEVTPEVTPKVDTVESIDNDISSLMDRASLESETGNFDNVDDLFNQVAEKRAKRNLLKTEREAEGSPVTSGETANKYSEEWIDNFKKLNDIKKKNKHLADEKQKVKDKETQAETVEKVYSKEPLNAGKFKKAMDGKPDKITNYDGRNFTSKENAERNGEFFIERGELESYEVLGNTDEGFYIKPVYTESLGKKVTDSTQEALKQPLSELSPTKEGSNIDKNIESTESPVSKGHSTEVITEINGKPIRTKRKANLEANRLMNQENVTDAIVSKGDNGYQIKVQKAVKSKPSQETNDAKDAVKPKDIKGKTTQVLDTADKPKKKVATDRTTDTAKDAVKSKPSQETDAVIVKRTGEPFRHENSAKFAGDIRVKNKEFNDFKVVPVDGGFAIKPIKSKDIKDKPTKQIKVDKPKKVDVKTLKTRKEPLDADERKSMVEDVNTPKVQKELEGIAKKKSKKVIPKTTTQDNWDEQKAIPSATIKAEKAIKRIKDIAKNGRDSRLKYFAYTASKKGYIDIRDIPVTNPKALALTLQAFRSPFMETIRVVYVKNGKVLSVSSVTSQMPNMVNMNEIKYKKGLSRSHEIIKEQLSKNDADYFVLTHNHPSGNPEASRGDIETTMKMGMRFGAKFRGHIISNHSSASFIPANIKTSIGLSDKTFYSKTLTGEHISPRYAYKNRAKYIFNMEGADIANQYIPTVPNEGLDSFHITANPNEFARLNSLISSDSDNTVSIAFGDNRLYVKAVEEVPISLINSKDFPNFLKNRMRKYGTLNNFVLHKGKDIPVLIDLYEKGVIEDIYNVTSSKLYGDTYRRLSGAKKLSNLETTLSETPKSQIMETPEGYNNYKSSIQEAYNNSVASQIPTSEFYEIMEDYYGEDITPYLDKFFADDMGITDTAKDVAKSKPSQTKLIFSTGNKPYKSRNGAIRSAKRMIKNNELFEYDVVESDDGFAIKPLGSESKKLQANKGKSSKDVIDTRSKEEIALTKDKPKKFTNAITEINKSLSEDGVKFKSDTYMGIVKYITGKNKLEDMTTADVVKINRRINDFREAIRIDEKLLNVAKNSDVVGKELREEYKNGTFDSSINKHAQDMSIDALFSSRSLAQRLTSRDIKFDKNDNIKTEYSVIKGHYEKYVNDLTETLDRIATKTGNIGYSRLGNVISENYHYVESQIAKSANELGRYSKEIEEMRSDDIINNQVTLAVIDPSLIDTIPARYRPLAKKIRTMLDGTAVDVAIDRMLAGGTKLLGIESVRQINDLKSKYTTQQIAELQKLVDAINDRYGEEATNGAKLSTLQEVVDKIDKGESTESLLGYDVNWREFVRENYYPSILDDAQAKVFSEELREKIDLADRNIPQKRDSSSSNPIDGDVVEVVLRVIKRSLHNKHLSIPVETLWQSISEKRTVDGESVYVLGNINDETKKKFKSQLANVLGYGKKATGVEAYINVLKRRGQKNVIGKPTVALQQIFQPFSMGAFSLATIRATLLGRVSKTGTSLSDLFTDTQKKAVVKRFQEEVDLMDAQKLNDVRNGDPDAIEKVLNYILEENNFVKYADILLNDPSAKAMTYFDTQNRSIVFEQIAARFEMSYKKFKKHGNFDKFTRDIGFSEMSKGEQAVMIEVMKNGSIQEMVIKQASIMNRYYNLEYARALSSVYRNSDSRIKKNMSEFTTWSRGVLRNDTRITKRLIKNKAWGKLANHVAVKMIVSRMLSNTALQIITGTLPLGDDDDFMSRVMKSLQNWWKPTEYAVGSNMYDSITQFLPAYLLKATISGNLDPEDMLATNILGLSGSQALDMVVYFIAMGGTGSYYVWNQTLGDGSTDGKAFRKSTGKTITSVGKLFPVYNISGKVYDAISGNTNTDEGREFVDFLTEYDEYDPSTINRDIWEALMHIVFRSNRNQGKKKKAKNFKVLKF